MYSNIQMDFNQYLINENLANSTISNHMRNYEKLLNILGEDFEYEMSDEDMVDSLRKQTLSLSQKLTISSTLSKFLKFREIPNDVVVEYIFEINNELKKEYKKRNKSSTYQYTKKDLINELNKFYTDNKPKHYIVSYLLIKFNVRNADLNLQIVRHKKFTNKENNFLVIRKNSIMFIRNKFKTKDSYGVKKNEIKNDKFYQSVINFYNDNIGESIDENRLSLFNTFHNSTKLVKRYSVFNLKESDIVKIVLGEDNTLHKASVISKNRGTSLDTLENSYNIRK